MDEDKLRELIVQAYQEESDRFQQMLTMLNEIGDELSPAELAYVQGVMEKFFERQKRHNQSMRDAEVQRANARTPQEKMEFMAQTLASIERETEELRSLTSAIKTLVELHIKRD